MLRFIYVIIMRIFSIMYFVPKMAYYAKHPEKYSEEDCYRLAQDVMDRVRRTARTTTEYFGVENLPEEGGYLLAANHQSKYDGLGILLGHKKPCSVLMDKKRSNMFIAKQFVDMLKGKRLDRTSPRQQIGTLHEMADELRAGRNYLVFPEGGYGKKRDNSLSEFKYGCFTMALRAECTIVPVAIIDCWKTFSVNSLRKVRTKVVYCEPIPYEEYRDLRAKQIAELVKNRIAAAIEENETK
ncbi:MAG: 1-acyl-sn-glycerol-3-phosphate acyltransferase [Clostridia bacterium]|nr:1-acyl-sn-glycerol-3-phosphate acyltransferase [Clostridia bacterium]